ncbi:MAG: hypothetical protein HC893_07985 [Chloroflexaceae bacterium]|nr:hypothetical protein [Chloroflexaceae bacterium]
MQEDRTALPEPQLCPTIAANPACRAVLRQTLARVLGTLQVSEPQHDCERCHDHIPAYIDVENRSEVQTAIRLYPHVWWALWTCASCSETYHLICDLIDAEKQGKLPAFGRTPDVQPFRTISEFTVDRLELHEFLTLPEVLGAAYGSPEDVVVVTEEPAAGHNIALCIQQSMGHPGRLLVTIDPPAAGLATLMLGSTRVQMPFDGTGTAMTEALVPALLADADGPDLVVTVEILAGALPPGD